MSWVAVDYIGEWIFNYKPDISMWLITKIQLM